MLTILSCVNHPSFELHVEILNSKYTFTIPAGANLIKQCNRNINLSQNQKQMCRCRYNKFSLRTYNLPGISFRPTL